MTVYMEKPGKRLDSILKWEYFYYDCLVLTKKNKVLEKVSKQTIDHKPKKIKRVYHKVWYFQFTATLHVKIGGHF